MGGARKIQLVLATLTLSACTRIYGPTQYPYHPTLVVEATFANQADWNSYVVYDGTTAYNASGTACVTASAARSSRCEHAGELRKVVLPDRFTSCAGLTARDALGAFDWVCDDQSGGAVVYSTGLKTGKGLRDLLDTATAGWRANAVYVEGVVSLATDRTSWWPNNPVVSLPDNAGPTDAVTPLTQTKTIYVVAADRATRGINLQADRVALVTDAAATLRFTGTVAPNCNRTTGAVTSADTATVLCAGAREFTWIEANFGDGGAALDTLVTLAGSNFVRVNGTRLNGADFTMASLKGARVTNLRLNAAGLNLTNVWGGFFSELQLTQAGLTLTTSSNNVFERAVVAGGADGVVLNASTSNTFQRFTVFGTAFDGVRATGTPNTNNVFSFFTVVGVGGNGLNLGAGGGHIVHDVITVNAGSTGLVLTGTTSLAQVASIGNGVDGVHVTSNGHKFSGALLVGNNAGADCDVDAATTTPGLDAACAGRDLSTALITRATPSAAAAFVGRVLVDDPVNTSDTAGAAASYPTSPDQFDFTGFVNVTGGAFDPFRAWGLDAGPGRWQSGAGRIWDLGLAATNGVLRANSGDGLSANVALVDGGACPAWTSIALTDGPANITYLANAFEVMGDHVGNEDGLCESDEACVAAPNFGAYQGDGDFSTHGCVFGVSSGGPVTGVTLRALPTNGR